MHQVKRLLSNHSLQYPINIWHLLVNIEEYDDYNYNDNDRNVEDDDDNNNNNKIIFY